MTLLRSSAARFRAAKMGVLALGLTLAGCEGSNLWSDLPTGGSNRRDAERPEVQIASPVEASKVAVGDSVLLEVRLSDDAGIDSVFLSGFSVRGSARLGTEQRVDRFFTKVVKLATGKTAVRDTTLFRYLLPTADSLPETDVLLVAAVRDVGGRVRADTVKIALGGPRAQLVSPSTATEVRAGTELRVHLNAADSLNLLRSVRVWLAGASPMETTLEFEPARARVDTVVALSVPENHTGTDTLRVSATNTINEVSTTAPVLVKVLAAAADTRPPTVRFRMSAPTRAEIDDSVWVTVVGTDSTDVQRIGVTLRPIQRFAASTTTLRAMVRDTVAVDSATFRVSLADLGLAQPQDTSYVLRLETTAFAVDAAGNCGAAVVANTPLSQACVPAASSPGDSVFTSGSGARYDLTIVRGVTTPARSSTDRLVDLVADSLHRRVLVSNHSKNRVEVLPFGAGAFSASFGVGSEPWGLALSARRDTLFVANSGGTNISVVPLRAGVPSESWRIRTPDIRLYSIQYDAALDTVGTVVPHDYSDRPQFLGRISSGQLIYSTKPTRTRADGTIRILDPAKDTTAQFNRATEIFTGYAAEEKGQGILVNALHAELRKGGRLTVWPRRLLATQAADPDTVSGSPSEVVRALTDLREAGLSDTRLDLGVTIASVGLSDTTFVAVSRDHSTIAFGEGGRDPGRIFLFKDRGGVFLGSSTETGDLIGNAAERVISLGLNGDGSLGIARGRQAYFFESDLRLQGIVNSGPPAGGSVLHPMNEGYPSGALRRGFVSGLDEDGAPYLDIVDTYSFRSLRRIPIRDRITGTLIAVPVSETDSQTGRTVSLRLFGLTASGVVEVEVTPADLR